MNSFQAAMNVKMSAVTIPGAASGSVTRASAPSRLEPSIIEASSSSARDRGEVGVEDPHREGEVEAAVDQDQRERGRQTEVGELALDPDEHRRRLEHLGGEHEQQEQRAAAEAVARRVVRGGHRHEQHEHGRAAGDDEALHEVATEAGRKIVVKLRNVKWVGSRLAASSWRLGRSAVITISRYGSRNSTAIP